MKTKQWVLLVALFATIASNNATAQVITGNDRDAHGCIASAGYTWSVVKKECIRIFESGSEFLAYGSNKDETWACFVVVSKDKKLAEVFLPSTYMQGSVVLKACKKNKTIFENKEKLVRIDFSDNKYLVVVKNEAVFAQTYSKGEGFAKLIGK